QAEDGIRDFHVTGVQTCALPIFLGPEEKQAELAARQAELIDELDQNVELQDQAFVQTGEIQTQLEKAGGLRTEDIDLLKRIELEIGRASCRERVEISEGAQK